MGLAMQCGSCALADFALIRHWRATFPTQGKAWIGTTFLHPTLKLSCLQIGAVSNRFVSPKVAFPLGGEGVASATDEGETGEHSFFRR